MPQWQPPGPATARDSQWGSQLAAVGGGGGLEGSSSGVLRAQTAQKGTYTWRELKLGPTEQVRSTSENGIRRGTGTWADPSRKDLPKSAMGVPVPPLRASSRRSHQCMYLDGPGRMHVGGGATTAGGVRSTSWPAGCTVSDTYDDTWAHLAADDKNKRDGTWTVQGRLKSCLGCSPYKEDVADRIHPTVLEDVDL
ncbi:hypothetical protein Trihar35433_6319 [Trichoderma harzianum]|nr:hypothetical protein Trihar35433_6319 [Trichoderma harzianum]